MDLSADVDFTALAEAALNASEGVEVHGPVEQGVFLEGMYRYVLYKFVYVLFV